MAKKSKSQKMDPKLVAEKQKHEVNYITKRWGIKVATVKNAMKAAGRSRAKIYAFLRYLGYELPAK